MADAKLTPEVEGILSQSTITENSLILPSVQLDRKTYEAVNKVLVAAGGKWDRKTRSHLFSSDPRPRLGLALETGVAVDEKKKYQAFFTPPELAARVADMASLEGHTVLEPSAGHGAICDACIGAGAFLVECVEINPENVAKLRAKGYETTEGDFLEVEPKPYSRIVMNPPFTKNQDIKHVEHALRFLAPEGILVAIMLANETRQKFQDLVSGLDHEITHIPAGAFSDSGTEVRTIILQVWR